VSPSWHVTIGWGRDYADVAPVRGVVVGPSSAQSLAVSVDVSRV
jgi:transglutaminase-like putative cysteine protease